MTDAEGKGLAVVTGASSGLGTVYADRLAARGYKLLLVARRDDRLAEVAADLRARHGANVVTMVADLEQPGDLSKVEAALGDGELDVLVNNAGAGGLGPSSKAAAEQLDRVIKLNVSAVTRLSLAALATFRGRGAGVLVNIGSILAHGPGPGAAAYSGSKAYVLNFTQSLQAEYAQSSIRIQLVLPGPIRTEFFSSQGISDAVFPQESFLSPEQVVDAAMAGLSADEAVTTPSLLDESVWTTLEKARGAYFKAAASGQPARRYART